MKERKKERKYRWKKEVSKKYKARIKEGIINSLLGRSLDWTYKGTLRRQGWELKSSYPRMQQVCGYM